MTSPLMRAVGDSRSGRRGLAMAFAFLLFAGTSLPVRAADDDPYSATVKVDASSDVIGKARDAARLDGQRRALTALAERRSGGSGAVKLPKLDDKAITDMVASFEVANERMSAVRYVADVTFHFRPSKVRRLVRVAESAPAEAGTKSAPEGGSKSAPEGGSKSAPEGGGKPSAESG